MPDWNDPEPFQLAAFHEALLFAYPTPADLNALLFFNFGKTYAELAPPDNYRNAALAILLQARGAGWLDKLVLRALQDKPQSPKLKVLDRSADLAAVGLGVNLEHIVRHEGGFQDLIPWVEALEGLAHRTCRIEYPVNTARGTGWLVGVDRVLTNWHVIDAALPGGSRNPAEYVCRFEYAVTAAGTRSGIEVRLAEDWCTDVSPPSNDELGTGAEGPNADTLDFALLRLAKPIGSDNAPNGRKRGWVALSGNEALPKVGDILFVIQHPNGLPVKLAPGDVRAVSVDKLRILHTADTGEGSSGSLVVDAKLAPIALHHAGDALYARGKIGAPVTNQAVPIRLIAARLRARGHVI